MLKTSHGPLVLVWAFLLTCAGRAPAEGAEVRLLPDRLDGVTVQFPGTGAKVVEIHAGGPPTAPA